MILEFDAPLVERAVLLHAGAREDFHADREGAFRIADPDQRGRAFAAVHDRWFRDLGLDREVREALRELQVLEQGIARAFVWWVSRTPDEGAELFVQPDDGVSPPTQRRRLVIRLRAETLVEPARCRALLRRELLHVADMIDPDFGYQPTVPPSPAGPTEDRLVAARYGAAWSATVVGRLVRRGRLPEDACAEAADRFGRAYPMLGPAAEVAFERLRCDDHPTHLDLALLAADPLAAAGVRPTTATGSRCSLCRMPAYAFCTTLDDVLAARIIADFPRWHASEPVCLQCGDLYRSTLPPTSTTLTDGLRGGA